MIMIIGTQTEFEVLMCDTAVECNLLDPPMTLTPKKEKKYQQLRMKILLSLQKKGRVKQM